MGASRIPFFTNCPVCASIGVSPVVEFPELVFSRCDGCGLIYKREQQPQLGDGGYEEDYFRNGRSQYLKRWEHRVRKCRRQVLAALEYAPHARALLDIGCSAGYVLEAAISLGLEPTGLDLSNFTVNLCREKGYRAEQGSQTQMPFPDASFDIVTTKHTLEHAERPMDALRELHRILRPGGVAFVIVPDAAYWKIPLRPRTGPSFRPEQRGWQHHVYYSERTLPAAMTRAGLVPVKAGKAIFRRRLAQGVRWPAEVARLGFVAAWAWTCKATHLRREIQLIVRKPDVAGMSPSAAATSAA